MDKADTFIDQAVNKLLRPVEGPDMTKCRKPWQLKSICTSAGHNTSLDTPEVGSL